MTSLQYAKVLLLRQEQTIRKRQQLIEHGSDFYLQQANSINALESHVWSQALFHPYHLEEESDIPLFIRNFLASEGQEFRDLQPIMESEDAERLLKLAHEYREWIIRQITTTDV